MDRKETEIKERVSEWLNTTALWQKILCFLQIILSAVIGHSRCLSLKHWRNGVFCPCHQ